MAMYDKKTFHWYRLDVDFFRRDDMAWLKEFPKGADYIVFYLELCLKALKPNGVLIRQIGTMQIPYTNEVLAEQTKTDITIVEEAMKLFKEIGLIKTLDNGALLFENLDDMIGEKSRGSYNKELQRKLKERQQGDICPPFCPPE